MNQKQLKELIEQGESQELDFKRTPENIGKDICGFANTNDGIILVGVSDKGDVIGTTDKKEEDVANTVYSLDKPVYPEIEKVATATEELAQQISRWHLRSWLKRHGNLEL